MEKKQKKHIQKLKQLGVQLYKLYWLIGQKSQLQLQNKITFIQQIYCKSCLDTWDSIMGYSDSNLEISKNVL